MPYYPQPSFPLIPALASAAAGYVQAQDQQKQQALEQQYMQQQMQEAAQKSAIEQQEAPLEMQSLQAQTGATTAGAARDAAEAEYYKNQIAADVQASNLKPPQHLLNGIANAGTLDQRLQAYGALESWYRNQPGGETVADKLMQYGLSSGASYARTQVMPIVANIGATSRENVADTAANSRANAATIAGKFHVAGDLINSGFKNMGAAFTGWSKLNENIANKMVQFDQKNATAQGAGNDPPYPGISQLSGLADQIVAEIQSTPKATQQMVNSQIDGMTGPNDAEKGFLKDIARQAFGNMKLQSQAQQAGSKLSGLGGDVTNILKGLNTGGGGGGSTTGTGNPYQVPGG